MPDSLKNSPPTTLETIHIVAGTSAHQRDRMPVIKIPSATPTDMRKASA